MITSYVSEKWVQSQYLGDSIMNEINSGQLLALRSDEIETELYVLFVGSCTFKVSLSLYIENICSLKKPICVLRYILHSLTVSLRWVNYIILNNIKNMTKTVFRESSRCHNKKPHSFLRHVYKWARFYSILIFLLFNSQRFANSLSSQHLNTLPIFLEFDLTYGWYIQYFSSELSEKAEKNNKGSKVKSITVLEYIYFKFLLPLNFAHVLMFY